MMKIFRKIPVITAALVIGVFSASLTAYAFFSYAVQAKVGAVQIADYAINITPVQAPSVAVISMEEETAEDIEGNGEEGTLESYVCSGKEAVSIAFADLGIAETEEAEVSFKLTASGNTAAGVYSRIIVENTGEGIDYYTKTISAGQDYMVSVKGNKDTVVKFHAFWGNTDMEEENAGITIIGDYILEDTLEESSDEEPKDVQSESQSAEASTTTNES